MDKTASRPPAGTGTIELDALVRALSEPQRRMLVELAGHRSMTRWRGGFGADIDRLHAPATAAALARHGLARIRFVGTFCDITPRGRQVAKRLRGAA